MNKTLITTVAAATLAVSAFGQGTVGFSAGGNKIKSDLTGTPVTVAAASPAFINGAEINITAFSALQNTVLGTTTDAGGVIVPNLISGTWFQATTAPLNNVGPIAGAASGNITMDSSAGAGGSVETIEIVAWAGTAATWTQALADGDAIAFQGSALSGGALGQSQAIGSGTGAATYNAGATAFNGLVFQASTVPEPTTMALGGLGAAALLMFRRRK
jgi:hypothetical protein